MPLNEIKTITPTHNPQSSPALLLERLWTGHRHGDKRQAIMISPLDQHGFLKTVAARVPGLEAEGGPLRKLT